MSLSPNELTDKCQSISYVAHCGQFRRDGVTPYFVHPFAVADRLRVLGYDYRYICVGYLHDVIEDTKITARDLLFLGVPKEIVDAVVILSKIEGQSYGQYLEGVEKNELSRSTKIIDINCNLEDDPTPKQVEKYKKALAFLVV